MVINICGNLSINHFYEKITLKFIASHTISRIYKENIN